MLGNAIHSAGRRNAGSHRARGLRSAVILPEGMLAVKGSHLLDIFLRSLTIQASFNFKRMQNLGFTFALLPILRRMDPRRRGESLTGHLQMFNTHPYLATAVIGSVVKLEEEGNGREADHLKKAVMGPYAAIGDPFFWSALRSFAAVGAVILALQGFVLLAPMALLLLFNPAHFWIRAKGFWEGYRGGRQGVAFISGLDLPRLARRLRLLTLIGVGLLAAAAVDRLPHPPGLALEMTVKAAAFAAIMVFLLGIRGGRSPLFILYGTTCLCVALSFCYG
jgi:PTS system mannose-specific IID component